MGIQMDIRTAHILLDVEKQATLAEIESARRKSLQALHPDKHSPEQKEFFERMTRNVVEAAKLLKAELKKGAVSGIRGDSQITETSAERDGRLIRAIADQLGGYAYNVANPPTLNMVRMLQLIGESCCETSKARALFGGMLAPFNGDYKKVKDYLLDGWR
jgi:hypothetical protein